MEDMQHNRPGRAWDIALLLGALTVFLGFLFYVWVRSDAWSNAGVVQRIVMMTRRTAQPGDPVVLRDTVGRDEYVADGNPSLGDPAAPLTIVEFGDFQCPFCKQEFSIIRSIVKEHQDIIYFQYRDFPLADVHPYAFDLALAGRCAHAQGKFWEFHDRAFLGQKEDPNLPPDIGRMAEQAGVDIPAFEACRDARTYEPEVTRDLSAALDLGARGTPTFFVNGYKMEGVIPESVWQGVIAGVRATLKNTAP